MIKINYIIYIVLLTVTLTQASITCYKCTVYHPSYNLNTTKQLCSEFEESEKFEVECPYSTMCTKKILTFQLLDGKKVQTITRNCASQKYISQVFKKGHWEIQNNIEDEAYVEGCQQFDKDTVICHCRGSYCNSAPSKEAGSFSSDAMTVLFLFNALKYLRSQE